MILPNYISIKSFLRIPEKVVHASSIAHKSSRHFLEIPHFTSKPLESSRSSGESSINLSLQCHEGSRIS